jgi:hypothetical protein
MSCKKPSTSKSKVIIVPKPGESNTQTTTKSQAETVKSSVPDEAEKPVVETEAAKEENLDPDTD